MSEEDEYDLSEGERQELQATREALRDVYGTVHVESFERGETMLSSSRVQLNEALRLIPADQRTAYDEALKECSTLVETESSPERFMRACSHDPWAAAKSICVYWQWRKEIFAERAFLPIDLTGRGAIPPDIVEAMKCGGTTVLPPDSKNRGVFYSDRCRFCHRCGDEDARIKVMFYTIHTMMESDHVMDNGYVIVTRMDTETNPGTKSNKNTPRMGVVRMLTSGCFPMKLRALHIIVFKKRSLMETAIPIWLKIMGRAKSMSLRTVAHFADSQQAAWSDLKTYCFEEHSMPKELGGTLDLDQHFEQWHSERLGVEMERNPPSAARSINDAQQGEPQGEDGGEGGEALASLAVVAAEVRVEEAKAHKRKLDAVYQKKKRLQRKEEFSKITAEMNALKKDNIALKKEQAFLESLLQRALEIANACENTSAQTAEARPPATLARSHPVPSQSETMPPPAARTQAQPSNVLNQLIQNTAQQAPAAAEQPVAENALDRASLERLAAVLQSGSLGTNMPIHQGDLLQQLQSTLVLQQLKEQQERRHQQERQLQQQLCNSNNQFPPPVPQEPSDQTEVRRLLEEKVRQSARLVQQHNQMQQQQHTPEPSGVAKYLQLARANKLSNTAPAIGATPTISLTGGLVGGHTSQQPPQQQQPDHSQLINLLSSQMAASRNAPPQPPLGFQGFLPPSMASGLLGSAPATSASAMSLAAAANGNNIPPHMLGADREKALQILQGLGRAYPFND